jgi:hypothetical protein
MRHGETRWEQDEARKSGEMKERSGKAAGGYREEQRGRGRKGQREGESG